MSKAVIAIFLIGATMALWSTKVTARSMDADRVDSAVVGQVMGAVFIAAGIVLFIGWRLAVGLFGL